MSDEEKDLVVKKTENPYDKYVPEALVEIRHTMRFSDDEKLRLKASEDIIANSSFGKQKEEAPTIVISNSNIQLLVKTAKEITNDNT